MNQGNGQSDMFAPSRRRRNRIIRAHQAGYQLIRLLKRFNAINVIARMCPQRVRHQRPTAAVAHDAEAAKSSTTPQKPIRSRPSCPRGLTRHIDSKKVEGKRNDSPARKLISAPTRKKMLRAVMPRGRVCSALFIQSGI
jgi:hypothetical protein